MSYQNKHHIQTPDPEERFVLLSLYMDGEASPEEKHQVEQWLATDVDFRRLYHQQLRLRQLLIDLPVPGSSRVGAHANSARTELVVNRVLAKLDERSKQRRIAWGGIAALAVLVGAVGSVFTFNSPKMEFATNTSNTINKPLDNPQEPLLLAMEKPLIPMPKSMVMDIK
jgi:anti-sigma factor RsiW